MPGPLVIDRAKVFFRTMIVLLFGCLSYFAASEIGDNQGIGKEWWCSNRMWELTHQDLLGPWPSYSECCRISGWPFVPVRVHPPIHPSPDQDRLGPVIVIEISHNHASAPWPFGPFRREITFLSWPKLGEAGNVENELRLLIAK